MVKWFCSAWQAGTDDLSVTLWNDLRPPLQETDMVNKSVIMAEDWKDYVIRLLLEKAQMEYNENTKD